MLTRKRKPANTASSSSSSSSSSSTSSSSAAGNKIILGASKPKKPKLSHNPVTPPVVHKGRIAGGSGLKDLSPLLRIISPATKGTPLELREKYKPTGLVAHGRFGVVSILSEAGGPDVSVSQLGTPTSTLNATFSATKGKPSAGKGGRGRRGKRGAGVAAAGSRTVVRNKERVRRMKAAGNKIVAVKKQPLSSPANVSDATVREWRIFNRLAELAARQMSYNFVMLENTYVERREEDMCRYVDLVLEYADTQLDEAERNGAIGFRGFVEIAFQLVWALWIAYREMEFVHYDLHKKNVLLQKPAKGSVMAYHKSGAGGSSTYYTTEWVVKINDFGCSSVKLANGTHVYNGKSQPSATTDIESLRGTLKLTITDSVMEPAEAKKVKDAITRFRKGLTKAANSGCRLESLLDCDVFDMLKRRPEGLGDKTPLVEVYSDGASSPSQQELDATTVGMTSSSMSLSISGDGLGNLENLENLENDSQDVIKGKRLDYSSEVSKSADANRSDDLGDDGDLKALTDVFTQRLEKEEGRDKYDANDEKEEKLFASEMPNLSPIKKKKSSKLTDISFHEEDVENEEEDEDDDGGRRKKNKGKNKEHTITWYTGDDDDDDE